jgi:RNA polymerase sigma-70 factor (ECF subfamily)
VPSQTLSTNQTLAARIESGDRRAEAELVLAFSRSVRAVLRRRAASPELVDDLQQDTFRILLERLRKGALSDESKLSHYVHRTAVNVWIDYARKESRRQTLTNQDYAFEVADDAPLPLEVLLRREEVGVVRELIRELGLARDRDILLRSYLLQQDKQVVCAEMGLKPEQFDRVIHRARNRFRALIEDKIGREI